MRITSSPKRRRCGEFFNRWLNRSDLESLGRTMAARRSASARS
jgi:hypothetical protein